LVATLPIKNLFWQLVGQDINLVDRRRLASNSPAFAISAAATLPLRCRVAPGLVVECVENRERRRAFLDSKPGDRARFGVDQRQRRFKEIRDSFSLPGLASSGTYSATLDIVHSLQIMIDTDGENATYKSLSGLAVEANQSSVERNGSGTLPQRCAKFTLPKGLRRHGRDAVKHRFKRRPHCRENKAAKLR